MRWEAMPTGSRRTRIRFAFYPTRRGQHIIWLEFYKIELELRRSGDKFIWVELT